ncbi:isochorismatase family protein [Kineosporia sp. J2-2]|uniref:Isochorismatase family protein n=1 Tax=Kineosporia corallincola TaxID=2835133 RepID=A0ABS5TSF0_9ACTN|nr:isochorismatase family cysteine hydrolase [Kineosporia corallincola]MBT0773710.1 isochorismatase family protein [Kineosporia corallincola]
MSTETPVPRRATAPLPHRNTWSFPDSPGSPGRPDSSGGQAAPDGPAGRVDLRRTVPQPLPVDLPALPTPVTADLTRSALVVVDMQNDFCTPGGWLDGIGVDVSVLAPATQALRQLVPAARANGVPVIWVNWGNRLDQANLPPGVAHVYDPQGQGVGIGSEMPNGSKVLTRDSWGAALIDGLTREPGDISVDKYRMSGFWDTPLDSILRNLRVDTLFLAGVNSDQCVYATLVDAACLGYDVVLVDGASATTSPAYCHDATLYNTRQCYGFSVEAGDLVTALEGTVK